MASRIRILELRSVRGTGGGPEKTILLGAARTDVRRFAVTVCYIRDARDPMFGIDVRARRLDLDYVEIRERHSFDPAIWPLLRRVVRDRGIDIVHGHDHKTNLMALLLAHAEPVIPLATAHGWSGRSWRDRSYYFFERRLLPRFPIVIAVSESIRRVILAHGAAAGQVRRIPNGIDHEFFRRDPTVRDRLRRELGVATDDVVIGSVGRLEWIKRFDVLLEAVLGIREARPLVVIAGEGACRELIAHRASALGLADRVRLLGHRSDIREIHHIFDVYVQSSDSEGIPNAVLEAMALETPVVATDVGGTRELITNGTHGLLVPPGDPASLAQAIEAALDDREGAARRAAAARDRVERELSFETRVAAVERVYQELVEQRFRRASTAERPQCA